MSETTITQPISDADLRKAICLKLSECFGAMNIANAIGGTPSVAWTVARQHRLAELVADALDRGLPVGEFRAAVDNTPFMETKSYMRLREEIGGRADFPK
jgi:hypothetical protein